ncbi:MAG: hypothetical protein ACK5LG_21955 [Bacteroides thetaiotaomicron]
MILQAYSKIPVGTQIRRMANVSNLANSTVTVAGVPHVLPLIGDGINNRAFNNPAGYGSVDLANDWFDIRNIHPSADLTFRVTLGNNVGGGATPVNGANIVLRFIPDLSNPGVYIDAPSTDVTFRGQAQFVVMGYTDGAQGVQVCLRTTNAENVRTFGIYISIDDIYPIKGGL